MPKASFVAGEDEAQRRHPEIALWSERADIERFSDPESNDRFLEPRERVAGLQRRMFPQDATEREIPRSSNVNAPQAFPDEIYPCRARQALASIVRFDSWSWNGAIFKVFAMLG